MCFENFTTNGLELLVQAEVKRQWRMEIVRNDRVDFVTPRNRGFPLKKERYSQDGLDDVKVSHRLSIASGDVEENKEEDAQSIVGSPSLISKGKNVKNLRIETSSASVSTESTQNVISSPGKSPLRRPNPLREAVERKMMAVGDHQTRGDMLQSESWDQRNHIHDEDLLEEVDSNKKSEVEKLFSECPVNATSPTRLIHLRNDGSIDIEVSIPSEQDSSPRLFSTGRANLDGLEKSLSQSTRTIREMDQRSKELLTRIRERLARFENFKFTEEQSSTEQRNVMNFSDWMDG